MTTHLTGALAAIIADPDCCAASKAIARNALGGVPPSHCIVPRAPTFEMKLAGATVITKEMMEAMANYDAALACWDAMVATAGRQSQDTALYSAISGLAEAIAPHFTDHDRRQRIRTAILVLVNQVMMPRLTECPLSHDGRHHVDTSMESGPNNCFHCEADMSGKGEQA